MADDYIGAFQDAYAAVNGLPTLYSEVQPEGSANALPNAVLQDLSSNPTHDKAGVRYETVRVRFTFYAGSLETARSLRQALVSALGRTSVAITNKAPQLFLGQQSAPSTARRGPKGEFMYAAMVDYTLYSGGV